MNEESKIIEVEFKVRGWPATAYFDEDLKLIKVKSHSQPQADNYASKHLIELQKLARKKK